MSIEEKKDLFEEKAKISVDEGNLKRNFAKNTLEGLNDDKRRPTPEEVRRNTAASGFAEAGEHYLKAPIIDKELGTSAELLNCTDEQIDDKIDSYLKDPAKVQQSIIPGADERKTIPLIRTSDEGKPSGHNLYALYHIQNPVNKSLINHEFLSRDGDTQFNWIVEGILTRDVIADEFGRAILMPSSMLDRMYENRNAFPEYRYPSTRMDGKSIAPDALQFLIDLSGGLNNIMNYLYPRNDKSANDGISRLETELGTSIENIRMPGSIKRTIMGLDGTVGLNLRSDFNKEEFDFFIEELVKINERKDLNDSQKLIYRSVYSNLSIYLKNSAVTNDVDIFFDDKVFKRIEAYCNFLISQDLFAPEATPLRDNKLLVQMREDLESSLQRAKELPKKETEEDLLRKELREIRNNLAHGQSTRGPVHITYCNRELLDKIFSEYDFSKDKGLKVNRDLITKISEELVVMIRKKYDKWGTKDVEDDNQLSDWLTDLEYNNYKEKTDSQDNNENKVLKFINTYNKKKEDDE